MVDSSGWRLFKRGRIFRPHGKQAWAISHAALPVADWLRGDCYRVYFSGRDKENRARIGYFELDLKDPAKLLMISQSPVVDLGPVGAFDDSGVTSGCLVNHRGLKYLYYSGWTRGVTVPFYFYIGLAVSRDGGRSFKRFSASPIVERNPVDPYLTASPCVLVENGLWRMWYVSGTGWVMRLGRPQHRYHIKYAESKDGVSWKRAGIVCIDYASSKEYAIARPSVIKESGLYKMWFCARGETYRLGYAESSDGIRWRRNDREAGMDLSASGWDSRMIAYPFVFIHKKVRYMFYNGNDYGKTGIGYAVAR